MRRYKQMGQLILLSAFLSASLPETVLSRSDCLAPTSRFAKRYKPEELLSFLDYAPENHSPITREQALREILANEDSKYAGALADKILQIHQVESQREYSEEHQDNDLLLQALSEACRKGEDANIRNSAQKVMATLMEKLYPMLANNDWIPADVENIAQHDPGRIVEEMIRQGYWHKGNIPFSRDAQVWGLCLIDRITQGWEPEVPPPLPPGDDVLLQDVLTNQLHYLWQDFALLGIPFPSPAEGMSSTNLTPADLPFPEGPNIAMRIDWSGVGRNLALMAGIAAGANLLLVPDAPGNLLYRRCGTQVAVYARYGIFLNRQGQWVWGRFADPLPIGAGWDHSSLDHLPGWRFQNLYNGAVEKNVENKYKSKITFINAGVPTPRASMLSPKYYNWSAKQIPRVMEQTVFGDPSAIPWAVKGVQGSSGEMVWMFKAGQEKKAIARARMLLHRGQALLLEERVDSIPFWDEKGIRMDWNIRVLTSEDENGNPIVIGHEIRYAPYGDGPVNAAQGAQETDWATLSQMMGWNADESRQRWAQVEAFSAKAVNALKNCRSLGGLFEMQAGFYGLDLIWTASGLQILEAGTGGPMGGPDIIAKFAQGDNRWSWAVPVIKLLARKAKSLNEALDGQTQSWLRWKEVPATPWAWHMTFHGFLDRLEKPRLLAISEEFIKKNPDSSLAWTLRGDILWKCGQLKEAHKAFGQSVRVAPRNPDAWDSFAEYHLQRHHWGDAVRAARKALWLNPHRKMSRIKLGKALLRAGHPGQALKEMQRAIREILRGNLHHYPFYKNELKGATIWLGLAQCRLGYFEEGIRTAFGAAKGKKLNSMEKREGIIKMLDVWPNNIPLILKGVESFEGNAHGAYAFIHAYQTTSGLLNNARLKAVASALLPEANRMRDIVRNLPENAIPGFNTSFTRRGYVRPDKAAVERSL